MTTRRDFLKGFAALASGLALAPASALAQVQRLGTPQQWVEPNVFHAVRSGLYYDPNVWENGRVPTNTLPRAIIVDSGVTLTVPWSRALHAASP